jgi:hypothetical protein
MVTAAAVAVPHKLVMLVAMVTAVTVQILIPLGLQQQELVLVAMHPAAVAVVINQRAHQLAVPAAAVAVE